MGEVSAAGVRELVFIDVKMNKTVYLDILRNNLKKSAATMCLQRTFKLYRDNDPKHASKLVQEWLLYNCPKVLHPSAQSPNLNPIEHVWEELNRGIHQRPITSQS